MVSRSLQLNRWPVEVSSMISGYWIGIRSSWQGGTVAIKPQSRSRRNRRPARVAAPGAIR
jgi:hypothetical protein